MGESNALDTEARLVQQAQADPEAFLTLYDRYVNRIFAYAWRRTGDRTLANDVTSATFEKSLRSLKNFRWRNISFGAWLYRIASNEIGKQQSQHRRFTVLSDKEPDHNPAVETIADQDEQAMRLHQALLQLSAKEQEIITLRFYEELSSTEVAQIIGCSVGNLYLRVHRALKHMRQQLEKQTILDLTIKIEPPKVERKHFHADTE